MFKKSVKETAFRLHSEGKTNEEILRELNPLETRLGLKTLENWFASPEEGNAFKPFESIRKIETDIKVQKAFLIDLSTDELAQVKKLIEEHQAKAIAFLKLITRMSQLSDITN